MDVFHVFFLIVQMVPNRATYYKWIQFRVLQETGIFSFFPFILSQPLIPKHVIEN